jgi:3-phosphoshikimate 1-carboxyvinyltransferase
MRLVVGPGRRIEGVVRVPGDKSIAHRWLMLAATARGRSLLRELPPSLDVRSTAGCLARLSPDARPGLHRWSSNVARGAETNGFTWDASRPVPSTFEVEVEGDGRRALEPPIGALDCGNSGTSMRLLAGIVAALPFACTLVGDESLSRRPMERVAEPLRSMGADVRTTDGHAPIEILGGALHGTVYRAPVPSAQVKSAVLLAGCAADGVTEVIEPTATRDHTERALQTLGAPIRRSAGSIRVSAFQHEGFAATVPGDLSSAAFLVGAAAVTGGAVEVVDVGLNPTRTGFLDVLRRMGIEVETVEQRLELGEPVGTLLVRGPGRPEPTIVEADELPLVIDEVPLLAAVAAHAAGDSWFAGAGELRVKESDRLTGLAEALRSIGAVAAVEGDDLVIGGGHVAGGVVGSGGDHRMAMAMVVAGLAAEAEVVVEDADVADVSFPGFAAALRAAGADVEG